MPCSPSCGGERGSGGLRALLLLVLLVLLGLLLDRRLLQAALRLSYIDSDFGIKAKSGLLQLGRGLGRRDRGRDRRRFRGHVDDVVPLGELGRALTLEGIFHK